MGRPKLYNTDEERKEAKQRNAKKWYECNKYEYNKQRRRARLKEGASPRKRRVLSNRQMPEVSRKKTKEEERLENIRFCTAEVASIPLRFQQALEGKAVLSFLTSVTEDCITRLLNCNGDTSRATDAVHERSVPFSVLMLAVDKYGGWLLDLVGTNDKAHQQSLRMSKDLRQMIIYIEDIICCAMTGELSDDFANSRLDFQQGASLASLLRT